MRLSWGEISGGLDILFNINEFNGFDYSEEEICNYIHKLFVFNSESENPKD